MSNLHIAELQAIAKGLRAKLQKHGLHHYSATTVKTLVVKDADHFENAADISHILYAFEQLCDNGNAELQELVATQAAEIQRLRDATRAATEIIGSVRENTNYWQEVESKAQIINGENKRLLDAMVRQQHEIQQILGKALGYPPFPPEFDAEGQVAVGDHVAESLAMEAAKQLASVTARLAAATSYRYQFDKGRLTVNQIYGYGDLHWAGHVHDYLDSSIQPVYFRTLEEAFLWLDHKLAAAVSAGWMKPLGENAKETT